MGVITLDGASERIAYEELDRMRMQGVFPEAEKYLDFVCRNPKAVRLAKLNQVINLPNRVATELRQRIIVRMLEK